MNGNPLWFMDPTGAEGEPTVRGTHRGQIASSEDATYRWSGRRWRDITERGNRVIRITANSGGRTPLDYAYARARNMVPFQLPGEDSRILNASYTMENINRMYRMNREADRELGHFLLDVAGTVIDPVDVVHSAIYFYEGDNFNGALTLAASAPGIGVIATGAKYTARLGGNVTEFLFKNGQMVPIGWSSKIMPYNVAKKITQGFGGDFQAII